MSESITIPMDVYDAPTEMVVMLPLGGVEKSSVRIHLAGNILTLAGERHMPELKGTLMPVQEQCYRGSFTKEISLPHHVATDRIWSELSPANILTIVIPKIIDPEEIIVQVA